ncbi:hypothetical protein [Bacillus sp. PK3_68]|nr:hypothetical protein [Bacillus sp. PK3_68]
MNLLCIKAMEAFKKDAERRGQNKIQLERMNDKKGRQKSLNNDLKNR